MCMKAGITILTKEKGEFKIKNITGKEKDTSLINGKIFRKTLQS